MKKIISNIKKALTYFFIRNIKGAVLELGWFLRIKKYGGNLFTCPCRGAKLKSFFSTKKQKNACPRCMASIGHRLVWPYLENEFSISSEKLKVLHFAPEYILQEKMLKYKNLNYLSVDLHSPYAMEKVDARRMPYASNCFDLIISSQVLQFILEDKKAMEEMLRVLKPKGKAIILVPVKKDLKKTLENVVTAAQKRGEASCLTELVFGKSYPVRIYGSDFKKKLEGVGFKVLVENYARKLGENKIFEYGLNPGEEIYVCTKEK